MSTLFLGTMATTDTNNHTLLTMVTEKPLGEFVEVKAAILIERTVLPIIVGVGMLGNLLCFITLVFTSLRSTSTCIYMAVIAVLDCIILNHALCMVISRYLGHAAFFMNNDWTCGFQHFLFYFCIHSDVLVLLSMTVDRFIVVKFPLKAQRLCTPKSAIKVIIGIAIFSFALNFHIFFNKRLILTGRADQPLRCWYPKGDIENFMEKIYTVIDATIYSFIPFISLTTLNLLIIRQLKRSHKFSKQFTERQDGDCSSSKTVTAGACKSNVNSSNRAPKTADSGTGSTKKPKASTNITLMLLLVSFGFLVLTSPIVITLLYERYYGRPETNAERAQSRLTLTLVEITMYSNHAVNFLLYSVSGRRFRQELKQLLMRLCRCF